MNKNELMKVFYKTNPKALFTHIRKGVAYYETKLEDETVVRFEVPVSDMGDADFLSEMDSKFLNRWVVVE